MACSAASVSPRTLRASSARPSFSPSAVTAASAEAEERLIGGTAAPNGNSVSLEAEMVKAVEVRQQHEMALAIYRSSSNVVRASLGRGR